MRHLTTILCGLLLALAFGCGKAAPPAASDPAADGSDQGVRIVALSPAISRTLIDLEMDHLIVGRTPFCDSLSRDVPIVGDLHDLDYESLIRVRPTHVLVQPPASGVNARLVRLAEERGWTLHMWRLDTIADIGRLIGDLPTAVFEDDLDSESAALDRSLTLIRKITDLFTPHTPSVRPTRVLLVVGVEPVTVYGNGTYLHEILLAVGDRNAVDLDAYPQLTLEDVTRLNPQAIILVRPGGSANDRAAFGPLLKLNVDAVRDQKLAVLTDRDALLPSSGVIGVAAELREILLGFREDE